MKTLSLILSLITSFNRRQFGADGYYPLVRDAIIIEDILTLSKPKKTESLIQIRNYRQLHTQSGAIRKR